MHDIYSVIKLITNYSNEIESIHAYDEYLIIGTKQGNLILFLVINKRGDFHVEPHYQKNLAKKPIVQVEGIPKCGVLIALSDGTVSVLNLDGLSVIDVYSQKGASLFVTSVHEYKTLTGIV